MSLTVVKNDGMKVTYQYGKDAPEQNARVFTFNQYQKRSSVQFTNTDTARFGKYLYSKDGEHTPLDHEFMEKFYKRMVNNLKCVHERKVVVVYDPTNQNYAACVWRRDPVNDPRPNTGNLLRTALVRLQTQPLVLDTSGVENACHLRERLQSAVFPSKSEHRSYLVKGERH